MKKKLIVLLVALIPLFGMAEGEYDWVADYLVVRTSEKATVNEKGITQTIDKVSKSEITIEQTLSERKKKDKMGNMVLVSRVRTTKFTDINEHKTIIIEKETMAEAGLVITELTNTHKTPNGSVTTIEKLDKNGVLEIIKRTTASKDEEGITTTTLETLNKDRQLVIRQVTKSS